MAQATSTRITDSTATQSVFARDLAEVVAILTVFTKPLGERFLTERHADEVSENPNWFMPGMIDTLHCIGLAHPQARRAADILTKGMADYYTRFHATGMAFDDDGAAIITHYADGFARKALTLLTGLVRDNPVPARFRVIDGGAQ